MPAAVRAPGQLPHQPALHRPEQHVARLCAGPRPRHVVEQPPQPRPGEVGGRGQPAQLRHQLGAPGLHQPGDQPLRPDVLPGDGAGQRCTGVPVPDDGRLALVRDAQRDDVLGPEPGAAQRRGDDPGDVAPDLLGVVLHPSRARVVLPVLALGDRDHPACRVEQQAPRRRRALVDRRDHPFGHRATLIGRPQPDRDLPCRVEQVLHQPRRRRPATAEQLVHGPFDAEHPHDQPARRAHRCGEAAHTRPVLPHVGRPAAVPERREVLGQHADGDDGVAGVALQIELVRPRHGDRREAEQALAQRRGVQRELLPRPQPLRRAVRAEDVVHQLDRRSGRHAEQDLLTRAAGQRVGPVHRPGAQVVAVPAVPEPAQTGRQRVPAGVAVLVDEPDLAQRAQDAVHGGAGQVQRCGDLREGHRTPGTAEQSQYRGGAFDGLDGAGHRAAA